MDSAVIAALIPTPIAVAATGAAFFAGRAQGRGAYRGPVDAVRRQHQRDAYAALLAAARAYADLTSPEAAEADMESFLYLSNDRAEVADLIARRRYEYLAGVPIDAVLDAAAVVELEGPDHLSSLAEKIADLAHRVQREGVDRVPTGINSLGTDNPRPPVRVHLLKAIEEFTATARTHLNSEKS
ncbi:hypothetical protein ACFC26_36500 [Kitasatospora purpeofusca]|uniref:hypothetical protein n=1 Tax=Kitasatospora purpeofusca TaxID=67352 RepID=UPI0035D7C002